MRRLIGWAAATTAALVLAGCATTMTVSSHVQYGIDFGNYRTYTWGPADALPTGDPRLDADPFFRDHLQGAVEKRLAGRGVLLAGSSTRPDLLLHYHAVITRGTDVNRFDREHGYCADSDCSVRVVDFDAGTIVLDMVDARTDRLVWRGWAQGDVDGMLRNRDTMARQINDAMGRLLERLPRAGVIAAPPLSQNGGR